MKRWPVIRHIRWLWLTHRFNRWWSEAQHWFGFPNPSDFEYLDKVWRGEA